MKQKIYTFNTKDPDFQEKLESFQESINLSGEVIIEQTAVDSQLIITTKHEGVKRNRNLLFDQINKGEMPNVFGKILKD